SADERAEGAALASAVRDLSAAPERLRAMGAAARRYVAAEHAPERAARAGGAACAELAVLAPPRDAPAHLAPPRIPPAGSPSGPLTVENADAPWEPGVRRGLRVRLTNTSAATWLAADRGEGGMALEVTLLRGDGAASGEATPAARAVAPPSAGPGSPASAA